MSKSNEKKDALQQLSTFVLENKISTNRRYAAKKRRNLREDME